DVPVHKRHFSLMFQDYALFPHLNVAENVAFGLKMSGQSQAFIQQRVKELLNQMDLNGFEKRRVTELSGGEQQRVALARALAPQPRLLMLDEPLGALDRALKEQLMRELRTLLRLSGLPAVYVTHDQREAFNVADRLILLNEGEIIQEGKPAEVYTHPYSAWVAHFLGMTNILPGRVEKTNPLTVKTDMASFRVNQMHMNLKTGSDCTLVLRPESAVITSQPEAENCLQIHVDDVIFHGESYECRGTGLPEKRPLQFVLNVPPKIGEDIWLKIDIDGILVTQ
ncbi:MAG: ABC transporter ATP-binding protein, partial [Anaerolineae bacterium]|nr:ABC transporter ATP-binding protein [Anaerolineae bacterium]